MMMEADLRERGVLLWLFIKEICLARNGDFEVFWAELFGSVVHIPNTFDLSIYLHSLGGRA